MTSTVHKNVAFHPKAFFSSKFLAGSPQYLTLWRILLIQGRGQRAQGPDPNLCDPHPPTIRWVFTPPGHHVSRLCHMSQGENGA